MSTQTTEAEPLTSTSTVEDMTVDTIRTLAMDAVQQAGSGHPGTAMALAPLAYVLWTRHLRYSPEHPDWLNRDRFVLSAGHASILQYAMLHLTGYDLPMEELQRFRQTGSITPGHPENFLTPGVETTTGPLGQGVMNSVGMAMAEAHLAARFNRPGHALIDHRTYVIASDGDLMEGASHEAGSLAGHLRLGNLIWIYDDNKITIDGHTGITFSEEVGARYAAYGWHVQDVGDRANDLEALDAALSEAEAETGRPSLILVRSHIGYGAPHKQDTSAAHGEPLGEEEIRLAKQSYAWPEDAKFLVPDEVRDHMAACRERGRKLVDEWNEKRDLFGSAHPDDAAELDRWLAGVPDDGWADEAPAFSPEDGPMATRSASGKVLNAIAGQVPWLLGGSADLAGSNKTDLSGSGDFAAGEYAGRNIRWGIREHVMCSASNGIALHGGLRPYAATFLIFTDYARPAIRLAALMELPVIYVMTHDSIGLGGDGPTHQPVEHLPSLRAMPGIQLIRPADANEVREAWKVAIERREGPTMLVLTRQNIPVLDRSRLAPASELERGGYVLAGDPDERPDLILLASGSEVQFALEARDRLAAQHIDARVVSLPCWERFRAQPQAYRDRVLPPEVTRRIAIEAASPFGWSEWVGDRGRVIGVDQFGASGPWKENYERFGLTTDNLVTQATELMDEIR